MLWNHIHKLTIKKFDCSSTTNLTMCRVFQCYPDEKDVLRYYLCIIEQNIVRHVVRYVVRTHRAMCRKITLENPDNVGCSTTLGDHI